MSPPTIGVAVLVSALVSAAGFTARALDGTGAAAAWLVGTAILAGAGWAGGAVLLAFFALSSAVSRLAPRRLPSSLDPKGERRDAWQVLANGGAAAAGAVLTAGSPAALWIVTGALAAAAADTWATAIGAGSAAPPRLLMVGRTVPAGTSGGMTPRGTLGALAGAGVTAAAAIPAAGLQLLAVGTTIGFIGMLLDSWLGATVQGRFHCPACDRTSEWPRHQCGARTLHRGGLPWLTNDWVNGFATASGAWAGWLAWRWWACC
ncbi:MAG TPA: DUF92 domain-containing protein [Gemmatimonadales bacterium]|nr:DUF92 domain-containing protein [Gemmatimonadales bacterium]